MFNYKLYDNDKKDWIIFIHGLGGSLRTWKRQIAAFSPYYNLLVLDLPGHGSSAVCTPKDVTVDSINTELKETMDYLGIKSADFVSLSLGSLVVANFAVSFPEYVKSIVFGGAVIRVNWLCRTVFGLIDKLKPILPYKFMYKVFADIIAPKKNHKRAKNIFVKEFLKMNRKMFLSWVRYTYQNCASATLVTKLNKANKNIYFISGEEDTLFINSVKKVKKYIKNSKLKIIEQCGHICSVEKYKEFNESALAFLHPLTDA